MVSDAVAVSLAVGMPLLIIVIGLVICLLSSPRDVTDRKCAKNETLKQLDLEDVTDFQWEDINTWTDTHIVSGLVKDATAVLDISLVKLSAAPGAYYVPKYRQRITEICHTTRLQNHNKEKQSFNSGTTIDGQTLGDKQRCQYHYILPIFLECQGREPYTPAYSSDPTYIGDQQTLVNTLLHQDFGPYTSLV